MLNRENLALYFSEKIQKITAFAMLFWFSVTKQSFENGFGFPHGLNVTLAHPLRLVILYFLNVKSCQMIGVCIFMTANETRDLMWMGSPIQNNC